MEKSASMSMFVMPISVDDDRSESGTRKKKSRAWEYFERLPPTQSGEAKAQCKYCKDVFSAKGNAGTSHLLRHIPKCPKSNHSDVEQYLISTNRKLYGSSTVRNYKFDPEVVPISSFHEIMEDGRSENGSKRSKSRAWEYFDKLAGTEYVEAKAQCKYCKDVFTAKGSAGTSHLLRHIPRCPKACHQDIEQYMISTNRKSNGSSTVREYKSIQEVVPLIAFDENSESSRSENGCKRGKSRAWEVFDKLPGSENGEEKALCKYCKDVFSAKASAGTSHLLRHIPKCPKIPHHDIQQCMISTERKSGGSSALENEDLEAETVSKEIAMMIVVHRLPFSTVEENGFRNLMSKLHPNSKMMDRKTIKQDILSLYRKEGENIKVLLAACPSRICLTLDTWKSITDDQYVCMAAHFVDSGWKLQKRILRFKRISPPYDTVSLESEIASCLTHWNIERKLFSITLANMSNNNFAASMIKAKNSHPCGGAFFYVRCCADILNLAVQAGFALIADIIGKLRLAIKYAKQSPHRRKNFYILARNLSLDIGKKLCLDCSTRWNSVYLMLQVALGYKNAFMYLGESDKNFKHSLTDGEWEKVSLLCNFLKVFYEVTCMLSGTAYPTANIYFKGLWRIHCRLSDIVRGPQTFMTDMVKEMQKIFGEYWSEYSLILSCAAILDPRYKVRYVEYCFTKIYGNEGRQHVFTTVNTLKELYNSYVNNSAASDTPAVESVVGTNFSNKKGDDDIDADYATFKSEIIDTQMDKSQLDHYLEEANKDISVELDVVEYWSSNERKYPELSRMARDVLSIPISTVASENSFRTGHRVISHFGSGLKAKTVEALICLQDWIRGYDRMGLFEIERMEEDSSSSDDDDDF